MYPEYILQGSNIAYKNIVSKKVSKRKENAIKRIIRKRKHNYSTVISRKILHISGHTGRTHVVQESTVYFLLRNISGSVSTP